MHAHAAVRAVVPACRTRGCCSSTSTCSPTRPVGKTGKRQSVWRWRALEPILSPRISTAVSDRTGRDPRGPAEYSAVEVQARWLRIASTRAVRTTTWAGGGNS
jgi:hypothetical protein